MSFSDYELQLFRHQIHLEPIGLNGQKKLRNAQVLLAGLNGAATHLINLLASTGAGHIGIAGQGTLEISELNTHALFNHEDTGKLKLYTIAEKIKQVHPQMNTRVIDQKITSENAIDLVKEYDLVIDCGHDLALSYLFNRVCFETGTPYFKVTTSGFKARLLLTYGRAGCLQCEQPLETKKIAEPASVDEENSDALFAPLCALSAALLASEVVKVLVTEKADKSACVYDINLFDTEIQKRPMSVDGQCPVCSNKEDTGSVDYNREVLLKDPVVEILPTELQEMLQRETAPVIVDVRTAFELEICRLENSSHIPLDALETSYSLIDTSKTIVLVCHHGIRSLQAAYLLKEKGFHRVYSLFGGLDLYAEQIDHSLARY